MKPENWKCGTSYYRCVSNFHIWEPARAHLGLSDVHVRYSVLAAVLF